MIIVTSKSGKAVFLYETETDYQSKTNQHIIKIQSYSDLTEKNVIDGLAKIKNNKDINSGLKFIRAISWACKAGLDVKKRETQESAWEKVKDPLPVKSTTSSVKKPEKKLEKKPEKKKEESNYTAGWSEYVDSKKMKDAKEAYKRQFSTYSSTNDQNFKYLDERILRCNAEAIIGYSMDTLDKLEIMKTQVSKDVISATLRGEINNYLYKQVKPVFWATLNAIKINPEKYSKSLKWKIFQDIKDHKKNAYYAMEKVKDDYIKNGVPLNYDPDLKQGPKRKLSSKEEQNLREIVYLTLSILTKEDLESIRIESERQVRDYTDGETGDFNREILYNMDPDQLETYLDNSRLSNREKKKVKQAIDITKGERARDIRRASEDDDSGSSVGLNYDPSTYERHKTTRNIKYDELIAEGIPEEEARRIAYGPKEPELKTFGEISQIANNTPTPKKKVVVKRKES